MTLQGQCVNVEVDVDIDLNVNINATSSIDVLRSSWFDVRGGSTADTFGGDQVGEDLDCERQEFER
jgi:hypothetical protein